MLFLRVFLAAAVSGFLLTRIMMALAARLGALDRPGAHKQHAAATPSLGGLAVFAGLWLAVWGLELTPPLRAVVTSALLLAALGAADDLWGVGATPKLGVLLLLAGWLSWQGAGLGPMLLSCLVYGWVASAFNGVDNADGAAGGLALVAALTLALGASATQQWSLVAPALALAGSVLGFLAWNLPLPRARIFLGDSGSLWIGLFLTGLLACGDWGEPLRTLTFGVCAAAVPLFDFAFILTVRGLEGRYRRWLDPITMCARDHSFHRLLLRGWSPQRCLLTLYAAGAVAGCLGLLGLAVPYGALPLFLGAGLSLAVAAAMWLREVALPADAWS